MKKNASALTAAYLAFLLMIMLSGIFSGILSETVYYLAYVLPFAAVILFTKSEKWEKNSFSLTKKSLKLFLPTVFPTVLAIILLSYLTSVLIFFFSGETTSVDIGSNLLPAILYHALLPAILEELLFRYLPMRYLAPYSMRYAVLFSSVFFALVHHSFFSIPYALFAGAVFMTVDLICDSILPSVILHFVNNAVSVVWTLYFSSFVGSAVLLSVIFALTLLSLFAIFKLRREYFEGLKEIFSKKTEFYFTPTMLCVVAVAFIIAIFELTV